MSGYGRLRDSVQVAGLSLPSTATAVTLGGGGGGYLGHVFVGGTGETYLGSTVRGGMGAGLIGYFWRWKERWVLLPILGVGGAGYTFLVGGRPAEADFSQATTGGGLPPRSFSTSGVIGTGLLAVQYFSPKGWLIGLQAGYERALSELSDWSAAGIALKRGPAITPQRFYVRFAIGGGGLSSSQE